MNLRNLDGTPVNLTNGSHKTIIFDCDVCGTETHQMYRNYVKQPSDDKLCRNCRNKLTANNRPNTKNTTVKTVKKDTPVKSKPMTDDEKNIQIIKDFLNGENIPFEYLDINKDNTHVIFTVMGIEDKPIEIRYVNSFVHKMDYKKRFNINGIPHEYFIDISHKNNEKGIRTIWVKDFEITTSKTIKGMNGEEIKDYHRKWEVLKSIIRTATGHIHNRIYARDCEIREVPNSQLRPFLELNCFYGYRSANKNLGLYLKKDKCGFEKGTLLFVYTFGSAFYDHNKPGRLEVIRVATVCNTQVIGGSSKCIKYFLENYPIVTIGKNEVEVKSLLFYVDSDHNSANSMSTLGFDFVSWKGNGFMNVDVETGEVFQRKPMKHKEIMEKIRNGKVYSVSNAGTIVYSLDKEKWLLEHSKG